MIIQIASKRPDATRRHQRARVGTESGFTVIELIVSMAVMMVVLTTILQALTSMSQADTRTQALANNADSIRFVAVRVARDIRSANPLLATDSQTSHTISANEVIMKSGPTAGPQTVVAWQYDSTANTLSRCTHATGSSTVSCETTLTRVNLTSSAPVFQYFCTSGAELNPAAANGPADVASATVTVRVTLAAAPKRGPAALPIQESAQLRNQSGATGC